MRKGATVELPCLHGQAVKRSSSDRKNIACSRDSPHISRDGGRLPQTWGRSGCPKILQPLCSSSCTQRTPAGLPFGMPGMADVIDGAMQQAPQPGRQSKEDGELTETVGPGGGKQAVYYCQERLFLTAFIPGSIFADSTVSCRTEV